jgi:hypothetical protein
MRANSSFAFCRLNYISLEMCLDTVLHLALKSYNRTIRSNIQNRLGLFSSKAVFLGLVLRLGLWIQVRLLFVQRDSFIVGPSTAERATSLAVEQRYHSLYSAQSDDERNTLYLELSLCGYVRDVCCTVRWYCPWTKFDCEELLQMEHFRCPQRCSWRLRSSGFYVELVYSCLPTFRDSVQVLYSRTKYSKKDKPI